MYLIPGGTSGKEPSCPCRRYKRLGFYPWFGKIPWSRKWQTTPLFLPGKSHGQGSLTEDYHLCLLYCSAFSLHLNILKVKNWEEMCTQLGGHSSLQCTGFLLRGLLLWLILLWSTARAPGLQ